MYGSPSIRTARRRGRPRRVAIVALAALLGWAARASAAIVITGGPSYAPGGGASCALAGNAKLTGGATWTCTGPTAGTFSNLYIGIRNDLAGNIPIGESMDNSSITGAEIFSWSTNGANTIVYTGQTTVVSATACTRLTLTFTGGGSIVDDATTQGLSNVNGAVHALWHTTVTGPSTFTVNALIEAKDLPCTSGTWTPADEYYGTTTIHGKNTTAGAQDLSHVDIGFYTSTCGDTTTDTNFGAEQCDEGGANGLTTSCCTSTCQNRGAGQVCRTSTGECDPQETCTGSSGACPANAFSPAGTACTDTSPPSSGNCQDAQCDGAGVCDQNFANETNGTSCDDSLFCNGTDSCNAGACSTHSGDPCPGPDGDGNCSESCNEASDDCTAPDPNGSSCTDGLFCNGTDSCSSGSCTVHTGNPCPGPDGDTNCSESCDESADNCLAADPDGTLCRPAAGDCDVAETCFSGACPADGFQMSGTACGSPSDTDCTNPDTCDGSGTCLPNNEPSGFACGDPSDTDCDNPDTCNGSGTCLVNDEPSGTPCTDDGETCTVDECDGGGTCTHPAGNAGVECRAASPGQLCDEAELCDGTNPTCPADGVKPAGTVCRPDAGECDVEEQCDGSSSACPPDVASPPGTPCGSPSDTDCSNPDTCDGAGACNPNNEPTSVQCRAASVGLACDAPEFCDGAGNCPADVAQPNGTPCRPAAGVCDIAENCDGVGFNCPADAKSTGVCRPAVDPICDVAESCDGSSNDCPADVITPDGTSCSDGLFCNGDETCASGACSAGMNPCEVACDEGTDTCQTCASAPLSMCRTALKSLLLLKNGSPDTKDRLVWKWIKGAATSTMDLADPTTSASYSLCIYDNTSNLVAQMGVPPDSTKWQPISDKGFKYTDLNHSADGAFKIKLKSGAANKAKALVKGRDAQLPDPLTTELTLPVRVQLVNNDTGICFQSDFTTAKTNTTSKFKAKAP